MRISGGLLVLVSASYAQHTQHQHPQPMQQPRGMPHAQHPAMSPATMHLMYLASGTSMNPRSGTLPMIMGGEEPLTWMVMGTGFLVETQQTGPRGGDKLYSPNWGMAGVQRSVGKGSFGIDAMLSLEPATITDRRYPLLFQTGETAFGIPIRDGQHPHNFVMGLGLHYARLLKPGAIAEIYYGPVGDPALGPVAFPHRASAVEIPQAPLGHHWQDSTHIATNVVTAALLYGKFRVEASGFHGAEPGENRWTINWGNLDSYSMRFSVFPNANWMGQFSMGRLVDPEQAHPGNILRTSASISYTRPLTAGKWSTTVLWGRNDDLNSYLAETVLPITRRNIVTGRAELVAKDELIEGRTVRVGSYILGYTRDFDLFPKLQTGIGFNVTNYTVPRILKPEYGDRPVGVSVFLRVRVRP